VWTDKRPIQRPKRSWCVWASATRLRAAPCHGPADTRLSVQSRRNEGSEICLVLEFEPHWQGRDAYIPWQSDGVLLRCDEVEPGRIGAPAQVGDFVRPEDMMIGEGHFVRHVDTGMRQGCEEFLRAADAGEGEDWPGAQLRNNLRVRY